MRCRMTSATLHLWTLFLAFGLAWSFYGLTSRGSYINLNPSYPERMREKDIPEDYCKSLGLHRKQKRICRKGKVMADILVRATRLAALECQQQFQHERWNCSLDGYRKTILEKGIKETAFMFAISSAGLVHEVSRSCAQGILDKCTCDETKHLSNRETWLWGGCGDNTKFGVKFTRKFLSRDGGSDKDIRAKVDDHNTEAGIKAVKDLVITTCKCHGVSGSCSVQTCWRRLSSFKELGNELKEKYERSVKVIHVTNHASVDELLRRSDTPSELSSHQRERGSNGSGGSHPLRKSDLAYIEESPDFCRKGRYAPGTAGRSCQKGAHCESLCCGRGYNVQRRRVTRSCKCEVVWCCHLLCQECHYEEELHVCK